MPIIYLKHPKHGAKVANMEAEAVYDESSGWKRYDPSELMIPADAAPEPEPEVVDAEEALAAEAVMEPANKLTRRRRIAVN
jgi:hypothetical protein